MATDMIPTGGSLKELILFSCNDHVLRDWRKVEFIDIEDGKTERNWKEIFKESIDLWEETFKVIWEKLPNRRPKNIAKWFREMTPMKDKNIPLPRLRICEVIKVE
jgi:hypothetical protein